MDNFNSKCKQILRRIISIIMKKKQESFQMSYDVLSQGMDECIKKINQLILDARIIIKQKGNLSNALGLFTLAVEEYGKALLLQKCQKTGENYQVPKIIFKGRESHDRKFKEALKDLPSNCKSLSLGVKVEHNSSTSTKTIPVSPEGDEVIVTASTTGSFTLTDEILANFETRMKCFYVDWNEKKNQWFFELRPEENGFLRVLEEFEDHVKKFQK